MRSWEENKHRLLAVFAHPDDETFRPGGTLALLARHGIGVQLLTLTHGEAGTCGEPALCTPGELPVVRERELRRACKALGIQLVSVMDYPDSRLAEIDPERIITEIGSVISQVRPQVLLSFGPDGLSAHPDHIFIGQCAAEAFSRAEGVAAFYTAAVPQTLATRLGMKQVHPVADETITLSVDVNSIWETKLAAMRCHATQWSSSPMLSATAECQRLFFGFEHFVLAAIRSSAEDFLPQVLKGFPQ